MVNCKVGCAVLLVGAAMVACSAPVATSASAVSSRAAIATAPTFLISLPSGVAPVSAPTIQAAVRSSSQALYGYQILHDALAGSQAIIALGGMMSAVWPQVIAQNDLKLSSANHSGLTLTVDQAFLARFNAAVPETLQGAPVPVVDQIINVPDFVFRASTNPHFSYQIDSNYAGADIHFFWKSDGSTSLFTYSGSSSSLKLATDTATASSAFAFQAGTVSYRVQYRADPASTTHGVFVLVNYTEPGTSLAVSGYGNDEGGAVTESGGPRLITEGFNATGGVIFQRLGASVTLGTSLDEAYESRQSNTDWGSAPSFIN